MVVVVSVRCSCWLFRDMLVCAVCDCAFLASKPFSGCLGSVEEVPRRLDSLLPCFQGSKERYTRNSRARKKIGTCTRGKKKRWGKGDESR